MMQTITPSAKIYIAGHTGLVGSAVVRRFKVAGFTNLILKTRSELNLLDQQAVHAFYATEKPEFVIVCAARVGGIGANRTYPAEFLFENLAIQNNLMWGAHMAGVKKLMFLGSSCIYPRESPQPMKEEYLLDGKPEPTNEGYAVAKIAGLKLCEKISGQYGKEFISCMPTNIYGEYDNFKTDSSHVIPALIVRMHEAKVNNVPEVVIWGDGTARREFLYVDDLADAIFFLMMNYHDAQFLNVGTGVDVSIRELAEAVQKTVGYKGKLVFDAEKPGGMPRKLLDVSRLSTLGWKATTSIAEGLSKSYRYYCDQVIGARNTK
jgi:GDP-L-fucose synthase